MRIGIIGGGAIGLLLGAKLALAGDHVTIWTRTLEQSESIGKAGIRLWDEHDSEHVLRVAADSMSQEQHAVSVKEEKLPDADWYVLALKQTDLNPQSIAAIVRLIGMTPGRPPLLCLQNGTGHIERLKAAAEERFAVVGGVTSIGAKREDLRSVRYTGRGTLYLEDSKDDIRQKMLLESLIRAGFDASLSNDILNHVYQKLLVNAIINPLTAIFDQPNGELPEHSGRRLLMKALHDETAAILSAAGMMDWPDSWSGVLDVCKRTSRNVSSMLSDVRDGRKTEIDSINGEVIRLGARNGLQAPLNESMLRLVEALSASGEANRDR